MTQICTPYANCSRDHPADCACGSPLAGDNDTGVCFKCWMEASIASGDTPVGERLKTNICSPYAGCDPADCEACGGPMDDDDIGICLKCRVLTIVTAKRLKNFPTALFDDLQQLLQGIRGSHKGSIGSPGSHYLPQLRVGRINRLNERMEQVKAAQPPRRSQPDWVSYCAVHDTFPDEGEPCWQCANPHIAKSYKEGLEEAGG